MFTPAEVKHLEEMLSPKSMKNESKKNILITGGCPPVGRQIKRLLEEESKRFNIDITHPQEVCFQTLVNSQRRSKGHRAPTAKHDESAWYSRASRKSLAKERKKK